MIKSNNITTLPTDNIANQVPTSIKTVLPNITVIGVGGGGGNAVNNMVEKGIEGVRFVAANSDLQSLVNSKADKIIQLGKQTTKGLGSGSRPEIGCAAAEEAIDEIIEEIKDTNMLFIAGGMGGGTGTGAAAVIAEAARDKGILTVAIVTTPFDFEGDARKQIADKAVKELEGLVDSLVVLPNQNLFDVVGSGTLMKEAFKVADGILVEGVKNITDLMVKEGLINLDFADIRSVMMDKGRAVIGTSIAEGEGRAIMAAEGALVNRLLSSNTISGAKGVLVNISGSEEDLSLEEISSAMNRIREDVGFSESNIIFGTSFDDSLEGKIKVSLVAAGFDGKQNFSSTFSESEVAKLESDVFGISSKEDEKNSDILIDSLTEETSEAETIRSEAVLSKLHFQNPNLQQKESGESFNDLSQIKKDVSEEVHNEEEADLISSEDKSNDGRYDFDLDDEEDEDVKVEREFNIIAENQETAGDIAEEITEEITHKIEASDKVIEEDVFIEIEDDGEIDRVDEIIIESDEDAEEEDKKIGKSNFFTSIFKKDKKEDEYDEFDELENISDEELSPREEPQPQTKVRRPQEPQAQDRSKTNEGKELKSDNIVFISKSMDMEKEDKNAFDLMDVIEEMEENLDIPSVFRK